MTKCHIVCDNFVYICGFGLILDHMGSVKLNRYVPHVSHLPFLFGTYFVWWLQIIRRKKLTFPFYSIFFHDSCLQSHIPYLVDSSQRDKILNLETETPFIEFLFFSLYLISCNITIETKTMENFREIQPNECPKTKSDTFVQNDTIRLLHT